MEFANFFNSRELFLMLLLSVIIITGAKYLDLSIEDIESSEKVQTEIGDFESGFFLINEEEIVWEGVTTKLGPNETVELEGIQWGNINLKNTWNHSTNEYGLRAGNIDSQKPDLRVLVLGNSQTSGHGVKHENIYTSRLENKLNSAFQREIEVINGGINAAGMADHYVFLTALEYNINPDVVIISDIIPQSNFARVEKKRLKDFVGTFEGYSGYDNKSKQVVDKIQNSYLEKIKEGEETSRIVKYGNKIDNYLDKKKVELIFACHTRCSQPLAKMASKQNITFLEPPEEFGNLPSEEYRYPDYHLDKRGHAIMANYLHDTVNWAKLYRKSN